MAGWTCPNCGTKNEAGLFNFCKKCGQTPPRSPTSSASQGPTARQAPTRPPPTVRPRTGAQSTFGQPTRRRRKGGVSFMGLLIAVGIIAAAVVFASNRIDTPDVDGIVSDIEALGDPPTEATTQDVPPASTDEEPDASGEGSTETGPGESEPPASSVSGPAVPPQLDVANPGAVRCSRRWNAAVNAATRASVIETAAGVKLWGGMQLATAGSSGGSGGPDLTGHCVLVVGVQPNPTQPALRAIDVYAELGPASEPRTAFERLSTVSLSYAWNARITNTGLVRPKVEPAS